MCISVETRPRITPACAGRRDRPGLFCSIKKDHPRVCGEKMRNACSLSMRLGSPPRVRGEEPRRRAIGKPCRITPACAGRSGESRYSDAAVEDHPRVCGEKSPLVMVHARALGSPPRVRGEVLCVLKIDVDDRITPACAGRRHAVQWSSLNARDHPRVCGEKSKEQAEKECNPGSPPRVRGEDAMTEQLRFRHGITPACAGRSQRRRLSGRGVSDHPRVCGEKHFALVCRKSESGSPPRVRGEAAS